MVKSNSNGQKDYRICVLGNFSGRNAGDMAILGCLIQDISSLYPEVHFVVPTINPGFVRRSFPEYSVEPVSLLPWALSVKIFGLPVFRAVLGSDLTLVTDNILFDKKLFNPLFNYLSTLSLVLPLADRRGIPVVPYNMSLGPVSSKTGKWCFERIIKSSKMIILRDEQSLNLIERLGIPHGPVEIRADCALNTEPCGADRLQSIIEKEGLFRNPAGTVGFNINTYLDAYIRKGGGFDPQLFSSIIAQTVDRIVEELGLDVLFVITQVMDKRINDEVMQKIRNKASVQIVSNKDYSYQELAALMGEVELLVGMRTHALILASSRITPVVGIISYPKTAGYLSSIEQDRWTIKFNDLDADSLFSLIFDAYQQRSEIRLSLKRAVEREKEKARDSARLLKPYIISRDERSFVPDLA